MSQRVIKREGAAWVSRKFKEWWCGEVGERAGGREERETWGPGEELDFPAGATGRRRRVYK